MEKIIVTIQIDNKKEAFDAELLSESTVSQMLTMLCSAYHLGSEKNYQVYANPLGRLLGHDESFEQAGVFSGALLTVKISNNG